MEAKRCAAPKSIAWHDEARKNPEIDTCLHMLKVRERRRTLRYRKLLVRQNVQLRNKVSQMLIGLRYAQEPRREALREMMNSPS